MRNHVIDAITEKAALDKRIMLMVADLGYSVIEKFQESFPDRFVNVGIAEQNMTAIAAGLAMEGNVVFTYSIGNFPTLRCAEQIRDDVCYHNLNVKILAVGGGFAYGDLGMTHHATEDIAFMRSMPNMRVFVPADAIEAVACLEEAIAYDGPAYIRLARGREPNVHQDEAVIKPCRLIPMKSEVSKATISVIASGTVVSEAVKLGELLSFDNISVNVYSCPCVKPIDKDKLVELSQNSRFLVTMEDHNIIGGLGGAVSETVAGLQGERASVLRFGLQDTFTGVIGSQDFIRDYYGISATRVYEKIKNLVDNRQ